MQTALHLLVSLACLAVAAAMIFYALARLRTDPPFPRAEGMRSLYWMTYLSLIVLGVTFGLAAIIH